MTASTTDDHASAEPRIQQLTKHARRTPQACPGQLGVEKRLQRLL